MYKIILLTFSLIAFIASCVYFKLDEFGTKKPQIDVSLEKENKEEIAVNSQIEELVAVENQNTSRIQLEENTYNDVPSNDISKELEEDPQIKKIEKVEVKEELSILTKDQLQKEINAILEQNNGIIFRRMSSQVETKSQELVKNIAEVLNENPQIKLLEVAGHTDAKGDEKFNLAISEQRAQSVRKLLIDFGISKDRLIAKGYGETMPLSPNDNAGYSITNRRVEFNIIEDKQ